MKKNSLKKSVLLLFCAMNFFAQISASEEILPHKVVLCIVQHATPTVFCRLRECSKDYNVLITEFLIKKEDHEVRKLFPGTERIRTYNTVRFLGDSVEDVNDQLLKDKYIKATLQGLPFCPKALRALKDQGFVTIKNVGNHGQLITIANQRWGTYCLFLSTIDIRLVHSQVIPELEKIYEEFFIAYDSCDELGLLACIDTKSSDAGTRQCTDCPAKHAAYIDLNAFSLLGIVLFNIQKNSHTTGLLGTDEYAFSIKNRFDAVSLYCIKHYCDEQFLQFFSKVGRMNALSRQFFYDFVNVHSLRNGDDLSSTIAQLKPRLDSMSTIATMEDVPNYIENYLNIGGKPDEKIKGIHKTFREYARESGSIYLMDQCRLFDETQNV